MTTPTRVFPDAVDVVVVGSGPCGATYARVLSQESPGTTIAMFEVGPHLADPAGVHVRNIADPVLRERAQRASQGPRPETGVVAGDPGAAGRVGAGGRLKRPGTFLLPEGYRQPGEDGLPAAAMSSNVGGMGAHWTCACPSPGDEEVIDDVDRMGDLLAEAEQLLGVSRTTFDGAPFADVVRARLAAGLDAGRAPGRRVQPMPLAVQRREDGALAWSGPDVVFGEVTRRNPDFTLFPQALVTRVLVEDGRAVGVRVRDLTTGRDHDVAAGHVVVAADALRTPQLLWASGIRPPALGRYLNDQCQVVHAVRLRDVHPTAEQAADPRRDATITQHSGVSWVPYTREHPFHGQVMQLDASPVPVAADDVPAPGTVVGLGWFCAKDIQAHDRVEFDDARRDGYGMPAMRIHYVLTDTDKATLARARREIVRAAELLGEPLGGEPITMPLGASLHYQGTVRLGTDPQTSVCDPTSQVWGVAGLRVAGNGVIPTSTACNPTLTSVALAVAGARAIANDIAEEIAGRLVVDRAPATAGAADRS